LPAGASDARENAPGHENQDPNGSDDPQSQTGGGWGPSQPQRTGALADALRAAEKDLERIAALPEADLRILAEDASQSFADRQTALSRLLQITQGAEQAHWRERLQAIDAEELAAMRQALRGPGTHPELGQGSRQARH